ncbi:MAG: YdaU family protein [Aquabacterium sp.]|uniref:YdaU family protein n=1 Tax=Aquabacterium sp. TaxID=1872578 RepID=UPI003BAF373A
MNYYEHHIRDYDTATAHLSWEEDLAYSRLLRWYYRKEQPIPADVREACRQVRAVTKAQRDAVQAVLDEFFELRDDGWHNETCDAVIQAFQDGEPEREIKKANEANRLSKHRKERADLFKVITDAGEHAAWNIGIADLRAMAKRIQNPKPPKPPDPATLSATQPATATATPATATQTPLPNTQYPIQEKGRGLSNDGPPATAPTPPPPAPPPDEEPPRQVTPAGAICMAIKAEGIADVSPDHPDLLALIALEVPVGEFITAAQHARKVEKPNFAYVLGTVKGRRRDAARTAATVPGGAMAAPPPQETPRARHARERVAEAAGVYAHHIAVPAPGTSGQLSIDDDEVIRVHNPALTDDR